MNVNSSNGSRQTRFHGTHLFFASMAMFLLLLFLILLGGGLFKVGPKSVKLSKLSHLQIMIGAEKASDVNITVPTVSEDEDAPAEDDAAEAEDSDAEPTEDLDAALDEQIEAELEAELSREGDDGSHLTVGKLHKLLFWLALGAAIILFLQLIQAIPWNGILNLIPGLAGLGVAVLSVIMMLGVRYDATFLCYIWVAFGVVGGVYAALTAVSLFRHPAGRLPQYDDMEYLKLTRWNQRCYRTGVRFARIPRSLLNALFAIGRFFKNLGKKIAAEFSDVCRTFREGDWKTRTSFFVMGFGSIARGQVLRGVLFLLFELVFIFYMFLAGPVLSGVRGGLYWLSMLPSLGTQGPEKNIYDEVYDTYTTRYHDNSFQILLYGVLTIFFIIAFIYTWRQNVKQNRVTQQILATGKPLKSGKDDLRSLVDDNFHRTLLALPMTGILIFTVMPIVFMILVAFTSYDGTHDGYNNNLFQWVGLSNFNTLLSWSGSGNKAYSATFGEILTWTLIWAFFATFTNYFLGMFVAMMINKKGIKFKKVWRTILVLTIAIPQFISLLYVSKMFAVNGVVNGALESLHIISGPEDAIHFLDKSDNNGLLPRIMVILLNIWIGIPYLMLVATGILMIIPADLYESAKIDGASGWKQYTKITLPYMLFITGPYLLTSFTSNMNNFNVIYLLTGGRPYMPSAVSGSPGYTDLLVTWLFKITDGEGAKYNTASVIGILVFAVVAIISLVVYGLLPSIKNEEDFQ